MLWGWKRLFLAVIFEVKMARRFFFVNKVSIVGEWKGKILFPFTIIFKSFVIRFFVQVLKMGINYGQYWNNAEERVKKIVTVSGEDEDSSGVFHNIRFYKHRSGINRGRNFEHLIWWLSFSLFCHYLLDFCYTKNNKPVFSLFLSFISCVLYHHYRTMKTLPSMYCSLISCRLFINFLSRNSIVLKYPVYKNEV